MKVLILEDEKKAAHELQQQIKNIRPRWDIIEIIESVEDAVAWFKNNKLPDLLFSDIQLADGISFEVFEQVKVECPVIFCTAFDEYAIKSFETTSIDYLLKPVDNTKLEKAITKFERVSQSKETFKPDLTALMAQISLHNNKTILVHHREKITPVKYADVAFFYYNEGVVNITMNNGDMHFIAKPLDEIEQEGDAVLFFRVNRQFLVNRNAIASAEQFFARKLIIKLHHKTPGQVIVSKARAASFLLWLGGK